MTTKPNQDTDEIPAADVAPETELTISKADLDAAIAAAQERGKNAAWKEARLHFATKKGAVDALSERIAKLEQLVRTVIDITIPGLSPAKEETVQ